MSKPCFSRLLTHCENYGFLLRRSGEGGQDRLTFGSPAVLMCNNIINEWFTKIRSSNPNLLYLQPPTISTNQNSSSAVPALRDVSTMDVCASDHVRDAILYASEHYGHGASAWRSEDSKEEAVGVAQRIQLQHGDPDPVTGFSSRTVLSCLRLVPSSNSETLNAFRLKRLHFWRRFAEAPNHFSTEDDVVYSAMNGSDEWNFTVEQNIDHGTTGSNSGIDPDTKIIEIRTHVENSLFAYLTDAFLFWKKYRNFPVHFRLAPFKVGIVLESQDATSISVAQFLREEFVKKDLDFKIFNDRKIMEVLKDNGVGIPFFITINDEIKENGILKVYNRETMVAEEIHLKNVVKKLQDYVLAYI